MRNRIQNITALLQQNFSCMKLQNPMVITLADYLNKQGYRNEETSSSYFTSCKIQNQNKNINYDLIKLKSINNIFI